MALPTLFLSQGGMSHVEKDAFPVGAMGIVAGVAVCAHHRITHMAPGKRGIGRFMTCSTKRRGVLKQKGRPIGGRMGIVTIHTALFFLHRFMFEGCLLEALHHLFVAIRAEIIP